MAKEPDRRGEHEISRKTIACGNVGCSGVLVYSCAYYHYPSAHEAAGAAGIRRSPRPLFLRAEVSSTPRTLRAARAKSYPKLYPRHCERSEAIHSFFTPRDGLLRRFAPRNDGSKLNRRGCLKIENFRRVGKSLRVARMRGPFVIASAAKQSMPQRKRKMDCFAALAMTLRGFCIRLRPRDAMRPRR